MTITNLVWKKIKLDPRELSINKVLRCGQLFRWRLNKDIWSCALYNRVIFLKQDQDYLHFASIFHDEPQIDDTELIIKDYFQLDIKLLELYAFWNKVDPVFKRKSGDFSGIRMLRQDPWENLISFICSQNNNVKRISKMCENLCTNFGQYLLRYDNTDYYLFPKPQELLIDDLELQLRDLGFGYRAKYIAVTSKMICESNIDLMKLRSQSYEDCFEQLIKFQGVGPKVADCVCLMSLDKNDIVPVDTHVFNFAKRDYHFAKGTLNKPMYDAIKAFFKKIWGDYAGWAHSVLFTADLKIDPILKLVVQNESTAFVDNVIFKNSNGKRKLIKDELDAKIE